MLNKKVKIVLVIIIVIVLAWLGYRAYISYQVNHIFEGDDPFAQNKRVLVDSVKVNDRTNVYRFTFDSGVFGHTNDFLTVTHDKKLVSKENSFFNARTISSISRLEGDTLLIKLIEMDYEIDSTKLTIPYKIELESEGLSIPRSKRLNIPIKYAKLMLTPVARLLFSL